MQSNLRKSLDISLLFQQYLTVIRKGVPAIRVGPFVHVTFPTAIVRGIEGILKNEEDLTDELQVFLGEFATMVYQKELELKELIQGMVEDMKIFGEEGPEKGIEFIGEEHYPSENGFDEEADEPLFEEMDDDDLEDDFQRGRD